MGVRSDRHRQTVDCHIECVYILVYVEFVYVGQGPVACNQALVIPVCKRGGKLDPTNYRPVSVTEPLMRLYAGILNARLFTTLRAMDFEPTHWLASV